MAFNIGDYYRSFQVKGNDMDANRSNMWLHNSVSTCSLLITVTTFNLNYYPNHTANDIILIPIEKIFSNRDSIRKAREAFLIQKGWAIDPDGLNIREETY